jgi:glycosyltransferase involved in cell wall biosynthesis
MDPHRVEDLAAKLRWLKRNPDRAQRLGENGRQSLRNRPWSAVIADYLNILGLTDTTAALPDRMAA